jgi:hypothetical protein
MYHPPNKVVYKDLNHLLVQKMKRDASSIFDFAIDLPVTHFYLMIARDGNGFPLAHISMSTPFLYSTAFLQCLNHRSVDHCSDRS